MDSTKDLTRPKIRDVDIALGRANGQPATSQPNRISKHQGPDGIEIQPTGSPVNHRVVRPSKENPKSSRRGQDSREIENGERDFPLAGRTLIKPHGSRQLNKPQNIS
jgi:hypothetical protein